jgi:hypothetical protein
MPRSWWVERQMLTGTVLGALVVAAVLAVTPAGAWVLRPAAPAPHAVTVLNRYTCDLSNYGYTGPPVGISASAVLGPAATLQTGFSPLFRETGPVSFNTSVATLPASVASQLANLDRISLQAAIAVSGAPAATPVAKIWGTVLGALLPVGPLTQLQVVNAVDTTFFSRPGTAWLTPPAASLVFTPYRNFRPLPTISCQAVPGQVTAVKYTVTGPASHAPVYSCASTFRTTPYLSPLSMSITTSGVRQVGHVLTVTLSSPGTGLAAPAPNLASKLAFTGKLPVTGAQAGQVPLNGTTTSTDSPTFATTGQLRLTKPGAERISYPRTFVYTVYTQNLAKQNVKKAVFTCALTSNPAGLTVQVAP